MAKITLDVGPNSPMPRRGDFLEYPSSTYVVLHCRQVRRRDPDAKPRYAIFAAKEIEIESTVWAALAVSAERRGGAHRFLCTWYSRKPKPRI